MFVAFPGRAGQTWGEFNIWGIRAYPKYAPLSSNLCGSRTENSTIRDKKISIFHRGYFPPVLSCRQNPMRLRGQREEGERGGSFGFCLRVLSADGKCKINENTQEQMQQNICPSMSHVF